MKQACIDTRAKYDRYRDYQIPSRIYVCLLCVFDDTHRGILESCSVCPWVIFEGIDCCRAEYYNQKAYTRRNRLDRWIKLIDEEIRSRG